MPGSFAPDQGANATACMNYLYGFLDGYYKALSASGAKAQICIPPDATTFQLAAVYVKWGDRNPEKWHLPSGALS
jgi:Rap1a immunity proteins